MPRPGPTGPELPATPVAMSAARASVLEVLRERGGAATVKDVSDDLDLHPNTVREHLDALVSARMVVRQQATPTGRGRPALLYRALHDAGDVARDYELLAGVLAAHIAQEPDATERSVSAGHAWGEQLSDGEKGDAQMLEAMERLGFDPTPLDADGGLVLRACPVLDVARRHPQVVCSAHLGLAQALVADGAEAMTLEPMAAPDGCVLRLNRAPVAPSTGFTA